MKRFSRVVFFSSLFIFLFAGYSSVVAAHKISNTVAVSQSHSTVDFYSTGHTQNAHVSIRHRSALQNRDIVINCPDKAMHSCAKIIECAPSYYAKWRTYFSAKAKNLPQAVFLPSLALRAPPVSC